MQSTSVNQNAPPGSAAYLPELVARARTTHPDLPLEPIVLQSLLLCLIAQPRLPSSTVKHDRETGSHVGLHLVLRTKEEDVGLVVNLVALVSNYLQQCLFLFRGHSVPMTHGLMYRRNLDIATRHQPVQ